MNPKTSQILFLFIHATILSISFCQNNPNFENCAHTFRCGSFSNLSYPFWGGSRPLSCGYPGFELNCDGAAPLLHISSLSYRVLQINFSTHTLKLARQDLWNNTCPKILRNTSLDPDLFQIPPDFDDANITLYFNCTDDRQIRVLNLTEFSCHANGAVATINAVDASPGTGVGVTCGGSISVPVNRTAARALETPAASSINVLRDALASGFFVKWSADNSGCENCRRSGGACGYDPTVGTIACYKKSQGSMQVGAATPASVARVEAPAPTASPPPRRSSGQLGKILGIVFGVIGTNVLSVAVVCYLRRRCMERRPNSNQVTNQDIEKFLLQHGSLASKRYRYSEIKKITKSFHHKLGQGGYGIVYKGMLPDGCLVAVKVLSDANADGEDGEEFINEVASISRTSHVNIVNLLGFCYDGNQRALVYEFMPNKSLDKFISKSGLVKADCGLDLNKLYKIAVGVAKGLEYLHTGCNTRIVHFDIKPQNILLDEEFCPKISDFGLAKLCKRKQSVLSMLGARGTIGYIAPEVFSRNFGGVSHKSDVYSYGMMLLKMAGATTKNVATEEDENYFPDKIYEQVVIKRIDECGVREEEERRRKMYLAGFWCVQTMPSDRPSISKVVEMLEGSLESIGIPPKPILFSGILAGQEISALTSLHTEDEKEEEEEVSLELV
ncbi:hypothetical protein C2S51_035784 [Perilla frutescens var. frutescens]|nr:hypothetical protein C2S51_035784 [Perilla frutescens var. frutescens]